MKKRKLEYLVIGGGPAGLQLGYYLKKYGRDHLILEGNDKPGSFFETYPRHRMLISINKVHTGSDDPEFNMRHDWNSLLTDDHSHLFRDYDKEFFPGADNLLRYLSDFVSKYDLDIQYNTKVKNISRNDDGFVVADDNGNEYSVENVIIATGVSREFIPDIPGIDLVENYSSMSLDKSDYENKRVLVIGKANSAFETADHLVSSASLIHLCSPSSITMAWKSHYVGHLRAINNNFLDTYQLKSQNAVLDADIVGIRKENDKYVATFKYAHAECEVEEISYDHILCCTGFRVDDSIYDESCKPELTIKNKYPKLTPEFESVNQRGLYFAGTLTHSLDYRKSTSGFIHGFRYTVHALAKILNFKRNKVAWEKKKVVTSPELLTQMSLDRINHSAGLWQQPGFIADFITREDDVLYYQKEMPVEYIKSYCKKADLEFFTVTLEYGDPIVGDPFNVERIHRENVDQAVKSQFLHPVVRFWKGTDLLEEHHVVEDLEAVWAEPEHTIPLQSFFRKCLYGEVDIENHERDYVSDSGVAMEM